MQGSRLQQGVLCPAHLTLQQAVLCVTCSLLCRSLICAPVLAGRHREVSQIRKIRVAKLDTRRFGHGCVACGRFRKVQSGARGFSIAWKVCLELRSRGTFGFTWGKRRFVLLASTRQCSSSRSPIRHSALTQTHHGGLSLLHRIDVTAADTMDFFLWLSTPMFWASA